MYDYEYYQDYKNPYTTEELLEEIKKAHKVSNDGEYLPIQEVSLRHPFYGDAESFYKRIFAELPRKTNTLVDIVDDHYGAGTTSFIDVWFYRNNEDFQRSDTSKNLIVYTGLGVLFHRQLPIYCMLEDEKVWDLVTDRRGGGYFPHLGNLDNIKTKAVLELSKKIEQRLTNYGLTRLHKSFLEIELDDDINWKNYISNFVHVRNTPFTYFDGLFFYDY